MVPPSIHLHHRALASAVLAVALLAPTRQSAAAASEGDRFFEEKIVPLLANRCYECHSHEKKIKGGLALDSRAGWEAGGEGGPVLVPGEPEKSRLISAVRHEDPELKMPPKHKLPPAEVELLVEWVKRGAPDPRAGAAGAGTRAKSDAAAEWDALYRERLQWWSLQPVAQPIPPPVQRAEWARTPVDRFILAALEAKGLAPAPEADRRTLARRLSFALTGLPPSQARVEAFVRESAPDAEEAFVESLLASPHFGERWARHWMDIVHYSDTHGYEWDVPAKNAWMYRDYLTRAFNADVPFRQLVLEQIAGDLIPPRVDPSTRLNEALLGPMAMRLGERRHGDSAMFEGIHQEAMANIIDTVTKGFLATTVACAQCHDHKLDAVAQRDYYALAGVFMSTRWGVRSAEAADPNAAMIAALARVKTALRQELAALWLGDGTGLQARIQALPTVGKAEAFPETLPAIWRLLAQPSPDGESITGAFEGAAEKFRQQRTERAAANRANLTLAAEFTAPELPAGWRVEGSGIEHGLVADGEPIVALEGERALAQIVPAGRWSHAWSPRLAGAVRSPLFDEQAQAAAFSVGHAAGNYAAQSLIVDNSFHCERMGFLARPAFGWLTLNGGAGPPGRRIYLELATTALNNYFPPRTGYGKLKEGDATTERSWFGVTRIYRHAPGQPPRDELERFAPLFAAAGAPSTRPELAARIARLLLGTVERWRDGRAGSEDALLLEEALSAGLLANTAGATPALSKLVEQYRALEKQLQPDRVIGSAADYHEARDERIGVRGSYTTFGDTVPRGGIRFLRLAPERTAAKSSGRLELAHALADERNPLTARVFVNRVWGYLFGEGLVRTPDDFGHLGERPSHPELLDWLASRFMEEGWSVKKLVRLLVTSAVWRQAGSPDPRAVAADPENRWWHHLPMRRLEAEAIRDALLAVSGRLDPALYGTPIEPWRAAQDPAKRLLSGPLDGAGRRSLYVKMTLMEPPRFLALFNQPIPKATTGKRDVTSVPDQALALLNDPFVLAMARHWSTRALQDDAATPEARAAQMFAAALGRPPRSEETARLLELARRCAGLRGEESDDLMPSATAWQDVAHAIFNLQEFIHVH